MSESLRDQLVKAGLATASQAKKAEREARSQNRPGKSKKSGKSGPPASARPDPNSPEAVKARARKQQAEKRARDRALADARNEKAAARALRAEIKQLITQNDQRQKAGEEDVPYQFVHGKKIKKIYVPPSQREQLSRGNLVIVNNDGLYSLVSREVAGKISERDPKRVITAHEEKPPEPGSDEEYYARFQVPDDLDW
jgi:uncharacterized protein YaiL (DUF2058 family)